MIEIKTLTTFEELQVGRPCRRVLPGGLPMRQTEERPAFVLPLSFTAVDIAVAFGRSRAWAWEFLAELELKGLVERVKLGKYKFCFREKKQDIPA